jgi:hypothetical protein
VPLVALALVTAGFFIFQPVKEGYRNLVWLSGRSFTATEKLEIYGRLLKEQWLDARTDSQGTMAIGRKSAQNRLSLLLTTAHYVEWTPDPIPYKNGSTLTFLAYGWIPRAVWPDKPFAQEANRTLPVEYGLQSASNINVTMFAVGQVAEAYANFGFAGIIPVFLLIGFLYRIPQVLLERERTTATIAIFVAVTLAMVPIGTSIGNAFGGVLQQLVVQGLLLRFFTQDRTKKARSTSYRTAALPTQRWSNLPLNEAGATPRRLEG